MAIRSISHVHRLEIATRFVEDSASWAAILQGKYRSADVSLAKDELQPSATIVHKPDGLCSSAAIKVAAIEGRQECGAVESRKNASSVLLFVLSFCLRSSVRSPGIGSFVMASPEIDYSAIDAFEPVELLQLPETHG